jgi:prevent-host-death family protein
MRLVTHREGRNNSGAILRAVAAGESGQVTNHGRLAAVVSPPAGTVIDELVGRGLARRPHRPRADLSMIQRRSVDRAHDRRLPGRW